jgi:hypothetical protein
MKVAVALIFVFAVAIGTATFIENDYGTETARALVYSARWFELLLFYFTATLLYNIFHFHMYRREKWGHLVLHVAFVFIAVGAWTTRYAGYEGIMHLREGQSSDVMLSDTMELLIRLENGGRTSFYERPMLLSSLTRNSFSDTLHINGKEINIRLEEYIPAAKEIVIPDSKHGTTVLHLMIGDEKNSRDILLKKGTHIDMGPWVLSFGEERSFHKPLFLFSENNGTI